MRSKKSITNKKKKENENETLLTIIRTSRETMFISDSDRLLKRINRKKKSADIAVRLKLYAEKNHPKDHKFIKRMQRQFNCNSKLVEYDNGKIVAWFCDSKICPICNSLRLVKFLKKYLEAVKNEPIKYNMVLTVRNPRKEELKKKVDKMYSFFTNSGLKKNRSFRELKKKIKMVRSFETTLNNRKNTYNIHFHFLLAGKNKDEVKLYGKTIIRYWRKYFGKDANSKAQYLRLQKKSDLENFKYLLKLNDVADSNIHMLYHLLDAIHGRRLFDKMNIKKLKMEDDRNKSTKKTDKIKKIYYYSTKKRNYYNSDDTKELLENNRLIKEARKVKVERINQRIVSDYFKKVSRV